MRTLVFGKPLLGEEEKREVAKLLDQDILVHGPKAKQFESNFAEYINSKYACSVSSCTAALHLAYFNIELGRGDEVIVPAQTHNATAHAVELCGATPVFVDSELHTGNIDIDQIESKITPRTKAISIVHYLGMPVDMDRINNLAKKYGLFSLEDCALAIGSKYKGNHVGKLADVGCFSFYPVKHMTTAEGGVLSTNNVKIYEAVQRKKAFGVDRTQSERQIPGIYDVTMLGFNYRMSEISAVLGIEQLKKIDAFLACRRTNYWELTKALSEIDEISLLASSGGDFESSYYCHSIILNEKLAKRRYEIVDYLKQNGVGTSVYYPRPVPHFTYYRDKYGHKDTSYPVASLISSSSIALPVGPHLSTEDMVYIASKIKDAIISFGR